MFSFSFQAQAAFHYCLQHVTGIRSHLKWISHIQNRNYLHQLQIHCRRNYFVLLLPPTYGTSTTTESSLPEFIVYCVLDTGYQDPASVSHNFMECFCFLMKLDLPWQNQSKGSAAAVL